MLDMNQKHRQWLATEVSVSIKYILDMEYFPWAAGVCKLIGICLGIRFILHPLSQICYKTGCFESCLAFKDYCK